MCNDDNVFIKSQLIFLPQTSYEKFGFESIIPLKIEALVHAQFVIRILDLIHRNYNFA